MHRTRSRGNGSNLRSDADNDDAGWYHDMLDDQEWPQQRNSVHLEMSVLLKSGLTAPIDHRTLMRRWADATRHMRWDEAEQLWRELMAEWLTVAALDQASLDQDHWNDLLDRRMAVLERREQRSTISDNEWDRRHEDVNS